MKHCDGVVLLIDKYSDRAYICLCRAARLGGLEL